MIAASLDSHHKKHLVTKSTIHRLISLALAACDTGTRAEERQYAVEAVKTLHNLASFGRVRYYIPGETASVSQRRRKFAAWGGLAGLYYVDKNAVVDEVKEGFEGSLMKDAQVADLVLLRETVKKLASEQEDAQKETAKSSSSLKENEATSNDTDKVESTVQANEQENQAILNKDLPQSTKEIARNKEFSE